MSYIKKIITFTFIILFSLSYAQKGKAVLILKDSTRINGVGEVSGISSIFSVKFKNDSLKYRRYKSKEIIGIDILENGQYRKFRYKYVNGDRFPEILEVVSIDYLSLYLRIYEENVLARNHLTNDVIVNKPNSIIDISTPGMYNRIIKPKFIKLNNGEKIEINPIRNFYYAIDFERYSYYVGHGTNDQVKHLYTKGLPFAKSFKKSISKYFKDCPELIDKVENKEFSKNEIWKVLEFYNRHCMEKESF